MKKICRYISIFLLIVFLTPAFADDNQVIESIIKPSITKHFTNEKIKFLFVSKVGAHKYYAIIRYRKFQDGIMLTDKGKLLSIEEDLNAMEEAEEGC